MTMIKMRFLFNLKINQILHPMQNNKAQMGGFIQTPNSYVHNSKYISYSDAELVGGCFLVV